MKDNIAMLCSGLCFIHCLTLPLLLILGLSGTAMAWHEIEWIHQFLLVPIIALAALSLPHAYKAHRSLMPFLLVAVGVIIMSSSFYLPESFELWLVLPASLLIIYAHGVNKSLLAKIQFTS